MLCQLTEKLINVSLLWLFPKQLIHSVEMLERMDEEHRRKTLGYFISALRERVNLDSNFDSLLGDFLNHRNTLVHDLGRIPGHSLDDPEGIKRTNVYVSQLIREADCLNKIFLVFIDEWGDQVGMRDKLRQDDPALWDSDFFTELRATVAPFLNTLVHEKPSR